MQNTKVLHPGYETLLVEVKPLLKGFETDITTHDRHSLLGYKGNFISAYRDNGTNLYRLDLLGDACKWKNKDHRKSIALHHEICLSVLSINQNFLFISGSGDSRVISESDALNFVETRRDAALKLATFFEDIDLKQIAYELYLFRKHNGRNWKSRLREEWEIYSVSPALKRLANNFSHDDIFGSKAILASDDEEAIFSKLALSYVKDRDYA